MGQVNIINYGNFKKNYYYDKVFEMYNVVIAERSGMAYVVTTGTTMSFLCPTTRNTLSVLKYEIRDFFFALPGTGIHLRFRI